MSQQHEPHRSFDLKLSLILMAIVTLCFIGYRFSNGGPRPEQVPCAPGQADVADCNQAMANEADGNTQLRRELELEGAPAK